MSELLTTELRGLGDRTRQLNSEIAERRDALEAMIADVRAQGLTVETMDDDTAARIEQAGVELDSLRDELVKISGRQQAVASAIGESRPQRGAAAVTSFAEMLLSAPGYEQLTPERLLGSSQIGALPPVPVLSRDQLAGRLAGGRRIFGVAAAADLDAGIPLDERLYPPVELLRRPIRLLNLITVGATDSDQVIFTRQTVRTSAAAETDLGVAYSEASFDFEQVTANVRDIGHFTTAHRSNIADAGQFDTLVRNQLEEDVLLRLESQVLAGAGTGVLLEGILETSNIGSVTRDTTNERRVAALHRGITSVRVNAFREPNAILLHPQDYEDMVLEEINLSGVAGSASMLAANLRDGTPASVWGLPIVVSPVATEGKAVVAYWNDATLWIRSGVSLAVSDSHSDYFTKRQVAILAEMRGAFSVQRPASFCEVNAL